MRYASTRERGVNVLDLEEVLKKKMLPVFRKTWHLISELMRPEERELGLLKAATELTQLEPGSSPTLIYIYRSGD